jgi:hypothetical protein
MTDLNMIYNEAKFWLPMITIFTIVIKAYLNGKKSVSEWADSLLNNHLHGIEQATKSTEVETKTTNKLLSEAAQRELATAGKVDMVQNTLHEHHGRELQVWQSVAEALTVLKERTRACSRPVAKRKSSGKRVR